MRSHLPLDTHAFVKKLVAAGVPESQAEVHAEALADIALANLATKDDLRQAIEGLEQRLETRLAQIETRFSQMELRLTLRFGVMLAAAVGIIAALKLL